MSLNVLPAENVLKITTSENSCDEIYDSSEFVVSNPEIDSDIVSEGIINEEIPIEEIPHCDSVHRCTFDYPNKQDFISNQFQLAKGLAMSVLWDKYSDVDGTHKRGERLYSMRLEKNPHTQKYIGFTQTIVERIRNINSKNDNQEIMYYVDIIHCPDDGIAIDIAHAHIQMLDSQKNIPTKKISKNHRMDLVHQIMTILNGSELITKT